MAEEEKIESLNLFQRLEKIRKPVEVIRKNKKGYGYDYVTDDEIFAKITGLMDKYHVSLIPTIVPGTAKAEPRHYMKTKVTKTGEVYEEHVNEMIVCADMIWRWVNNDNTDECIDIPWFTVGSQSDVSQAFGSGLTYSRRYFLLQYFHIATVSDDPDNWRSKQKEAEETENAMISKEIVDQVHVIVTEFLSNNPKCKDDMVTVIKEYAKDKNNRATANYMSIKDPKIAAKVLEEVNKYISSISASESKAASKSKKNKEEE